MNESLWNDLTGKLVLVREDTNIVKYIIVKHVGEGSFVVAEYKNPKNHKILHESLLTIGKKEDQPKDLDLTPYLEAVGNYSPQ